MDQYLKVDQWQKKSEKESKKDEKQKEDQKEDQKEEPSSFQRLCMQPSSKKSMKMTKSLVTQQGSK